METDTRILKTDDKEISDILGDDRLHDFYIRYGEELAKDAHILVELYSKWIERVPSKEKMARIANYSSIKAQQFVNEYHDELSEGERARYMQIVLEVPLLASAILAMAELGAKYTKSMTDLEKKVSEDKK